MELSTGYPQVNEAVYEAVDNLWITIQIRMILIYIPHRVSIHVHKHISTLTMSYANANPFSLAWPARAHTRTYAPARQHAHIRASMRQRTRTKQTPCHAALHNKTIRDYPMPLKRARNAYKPFSPLTHTLPFENLVIATSAFSRDYP
jgi:hypothetical protein